MRIRDWSSDVCSSDLGVEVVLKDQRRELGDLDGGMDRFPFAVGDAEQDQRRALGMAFEMALHRHDLGGLMLQRVQTVEVADEDLDRGDQREIERASVREGGGQYV